MVTVHVAGGRNHLVSIALFRMAVRVTRLTKSLWIIIVCQALCLAFGLWIHYHLVFSFARWTPKTAAMQSSVDLHSISTVNLGQTQLLSTALSPGVGVLVVDSQWRLLAAPTSDETNWQAGQKVEWEWSSDSNRSQSEARRGKLTIPQGSHDGFAYRLNEGAGYTIVYDCQNDALPSAASFVGAIPLASSVGFVWTCGLQCIVVYLVLSRVYIEHVRKQTESQEASLQHRHDLVRTRDAVIFGLAKLAESRDSDTGQHLERISLYATCMASSLRRHPKFRDEVTPAFVRLIGISSALHDIGKVGVEDAILLKPGKLTETERAEMQRHANIGGECLKQIEQRLGNSNFLQMAREIALHHHERWDGAGYPCGLAGEQIPLSARLVSIVDVYDALSVKRVYKNAYDHAKCVTIIRNEAGSQFDPDLVDVFLKLEKQFQEISCRFSEPSVDSTTSRREMAGLLADDELACVHQKDRQLAIDESSRIEDTTGTST